MRAWPCSLWQWYCSLPGTDFDRIINCCWSTIAFLGWCSKRSRERVANSQYVLVSFVEFKHL